MASVSGVNLAMLAEDEDAFLDWLATTGEIWAACDLGESGQVRYESGPVQEFRRRFGRRIVRDGQVCLYLGHRADVLKPKVRTVAIRSATPPRRREIDERASLLIAYRHGLVDRHGVLERTSVYYYPSFLKGNAWVQKPEAWVKWTRSVVRWLRRRASEAVPVYQLQDTIPATPAAKEAVRAGLKVV